MFKIVERWKLWFSISLIIIIIGVGTWLIKDLNYGIDFKGGTVVTIKIGKDFNVEDIRKIAAKYDPKASAREILEGKKVEISSKDFTDDQIAQLFNEIKAKYQLDDTAREATKRIGPSIGKELRQKAITSSIVATLGILIYTSFRFELKSGVAAIIALLHDLLVMVSVYAVLQIPVNSSFIAAMLTILGYSINDTIVVFDRIRENRRLGKYKSFAITADASITQTLSRSINTVLTTLFTITAVYIFGVSSIKDFALPLIVGIISGCYSSIFIASPIWVMLEKRGKIA
ncbi:protein translocase subunit SecF [Caloramator sp. E03]|uniref:protein translocase subunit SecF n=1 Tax=Caloramator sp. E03 TaxID=2576307 RepID=UPI0011106F04|nr:protein translocase subunit SecF [Caloramator sp. E03]QCX34773.1 protein translocase subunit SecF [Caloramator sp. E03]